MFLLQVAFFFVFTIFSSAISCAQKYSISGTISDASTGETILGASVFVEDMEKGVSSNVYGFYSLSLPKGSYKISYSFIGYKTIKKTVELNQDITFNAKLESAVIMGSTVEIVGKKGENVNSTDVGRVELEVDQIKKLPALLGEVDILKTIQLLPGIQSAGEGNSGFYVRGGGPDQNLILVDNAVVYNASHLFGFFSVFNADAVKHIDVIKGGMPAKFGGRVSSVL
ncbi:MAG: carboxypeptidase-like regulatory domain-containing protein, partial [Flavobacteriales bacterium]